MLLWLQFCSFRPKATTANRPRALGHSKISFFFDTRNKAEPLKITGTVCPGPLKVGTTIAQMLLWLQFCSFQPLQRNKPKLLPNASHAALMPCCPCCTLLACFPATLLPCCCPATLMTLLTWATLMSSLNWPIFLTLTTLTT